MGIGDWGLGPIPNPQSPIPNPQSPLIKEIIKNKKFLIIKLKELLIFTYWKNKINFLKIWNQKNFQNFNLIKKII